MRLSKIKLAGFKSFVDPTVFPVSSSLVAIVGPNGCGKSNIVDAVRWVMGESSSRQLRGESMEDVIFNGSAARQPVGQATIELVFDNSDGKLGGPWASYNEIAVKRVLNRGGQSAYFINNSRCRRRDITAIFLGTGLGPRSYAIIEQGTISRVIESKPEELRVLLEEAAGISRYKERRRETENRIRHTRDNLLRLRDVREELARQLQHLKRQAANAQRYKRYRVEERQLKAQLLALRWKSLDDELGQRDRHIGEQENRLEALRAEQRSIDTELLAGRQRHSEYNDSLNRAQAGHYELGAEIARLEQTLDHHRQLRQQQQQEHQRIEQTLQQLDQQRQQDDERLLALTTALRQAESALQEARGEQRAGDQEVADREAALDDWRSAWQTVSQARAAAQRDAEVERARIEQLERLQLTARQRLERLQVQQDQAIERQQTAALDKLREQTAAIALDLEQRQNESAALENRIGELREQLQGQQQALNDGRERLQNARARLSSLTTLQRAALGGQDQALNAWLAAQQLQHAPRLAQRIEVEAGWERAVETALAAYLPAVCIDEAALESAAAAVARLEHGRLALLTPAEPPSRASSELAAKIRAPWPLNHLLAGIRLADSLDDALAQRAALGEGESLVTPDGLWLGRDWLRVERPLGDGVSTGVVLREREMRGLQAAVDRDTRALGERQRVVERISDELQALDAARKNLQETLNRQLRDHTRLHGQYSAAESRLAEQRQRREEAVRELADLSQQLQASSGELRAARERLEQALATLQRHHRQETDLNRQHQRLRSALDSARAGAETARRNAQAQALALETLRSEQRALDQALQRLNGQREQLETRREQLAAAAPADDAAPLRARLDALLAQRLASEQRLADARSALQTQDRQLQELEQARSDNERAQHPHRQSLEALRLARAEAEVRRQHLLEQLNELETQPSAVLQELPEHADETGWQQQLADLANRIQRLGAINLAAIEEYQQLAERKGYLDAQNEDLLQALATLEDAMAKIDRETRTRFKHMFERINTRIAELFPRLFGGGQAFLEMAGDDALDAGVSIMAQPPGKRVGSIQLLSGGEKALTAVALVFAIFQLNPAPFCLLDEVDAPLDDQNVGRFGGLLQELSEQVQFIIVTHNKASMEIAHQLTGVTMHEPGVSRLVAVDVDQAVRLAIA